MTHVNVIIIVRVKIHIKLKPTNKVITEHNHNQEKFHKKKVMDLTLKYMKKSVNLNEAKQSMEGQGESWSRYKTQWKQGVTPAIQDNRKSCCFLL